VAIMMVEAESTPETLKLIADADSGARGADRGHGGRGPGGGQKPFLRVLIEAQQRLADQVDSTVVARVPGVRRLRRGRVTRRSRVKSPASSRRCSRSRQSTSARPRPTGSGALARGGESSPSSSKAVRKEISAAFRSLTKKLVRERIISEGLRIDGARADRHPAADRPDARSAPGTRNRPCSSAARPRSWA